MSNDTKIEPALSPEAWRIKAFHGLTGYAKVIADGNGRVGLEIGDKPHHAKYWFADDDPEPMMVGLRQLMALANYALPDASPYKITRADVEALNWTHPEMTNGEHDEHRRALDKLRALLPPE